MASKLYQIPIQYDTDSISIAFYSKNKNLKIFFRSTFICKDPIQYDTDSIPHIGKHTSFVVLIKLADAFDLNLIRFFLLYCCL